MLPTHCGNQWYSVEVLHTCLQTVSWLVSDVLAGGGVEEDNGENIQVPHAVDPCEKSAVELEGVVANVPVTLTDLMREHLESVLFCFFFQKEVDNLMKNQEKDFQF